MKVLCKHCQSSCKKIGLVECSSYNAKANRPQQLQIQINEAYKSHDYELARKLSEELFRLNHG
jgi:hypothetical protein